MSEQSIQKLSIDTIRTLSMDGVQAANSGHPGAPMALAPVAYVLYREMMQHNPNNPNWANRDRFILSNGHASMLLYSVLHLSGYDISLDELKKFRQWGSKTPGHPEYGITPGAETTTGPLGQGFMNGIGMAMAEAQLAAKFNRPNHNIIDHFTYAICSDGDIMEGASHEAASIAGHMGLGKVIYVYDDNHITIEGDTSLAFSEDVEKRFESYGWHVQNLGESANDVDGLKRAIETAKQVKDKPSLIIVRTHIGYGSPNKVDTSGVHGSPLGHDEILLTKQALGYPSEEPFYVDPSVIDHMQTYISERGQQLEAAWNQALAAYETAYPELASALKSTLDLTIPEGWDSELPTFIPADGPIATRAINSKFLNAVASKLPWLVGGSADLEPSTKTFMQGYPYLSKSDYTGRNLTWGIREMAMGGTATGMQLHGGVRPYAATFFVFTDYMRPAIRLAALMELPIIYVMTHDSVGLGEDGPTHQPIEHLSSLRAMPNLTVIRPADANETIEAWKAAIEHQDGPTLLVLTRQKIPVLDPDQIADVKGLHRGAYTISAEEGEKPDVILIATGSEVAVALEAQKILNEDEIDARVVSMPSWELFESQERGYQDSVLPPEVTARVSIEAGATFGWQRWTGDRGMAIGIDHFGISAPYQLIFERFGITAQKMAAEAKRILA